MKKCVAFVFILLVGACTADKKPLDTRELAHSQGGGAHHLMYLRAPKPFEKNPLYMDRVENSWSFPAKRDVFDESALLDLSFLNSSIKDKSDRIILSKDRESFSYKNGEPFRVWAVNLGLSDRTAKELNEQIHFLAKRGVNMIRLHTAINPKGDENDFHDIDQKVLDRIFKIIPALRKHGVYLTLSPYWGPSLKREGWGKAIGRNWPVPRDSSASTAAGLLFFDPILQEAYREWLRKLLVTVNPYTGVALKDEPSLAVFQLQNEDSLLFWTFGAIQGEDLKLLSRQFGAWLSSKYGSLDELEKRWGGARAEGAKIEDDWANGTVALANLWHLTRADLKGGFRTRIDDQTQFLLETMTSFNKNILRFLRNEVKTSVLVNAGNWKTASAALLDDLERFSYSPAEVIAVNRYMSSLHQGTNNGWAIVSGHKYTEASVFFDPQALPLAVKQVSEHPFLITESNWVPPVSFQAEGAFFASVYQSIAGVDGFYWFSAGETQWLTPSSANGYLPSLGKWVIQTPMVLGQFPAAALSYRLGLVEQGQPSAKEYRTLTDLKKRTPAKIVERQGYDLNRDDSQSRDSSKLGEAFLVGPVFTEVGTKGISRISTYGEDRWRKGDTVFSNGGQLQWDLKHGAALLNTPASQAVCGFLNGAEVESKDVVFEVFSPYACIWLVSMDGEPLGESSKILVQMGTRQFPTGWETKPATLKQGDRWVDGREVIEFGSSPWQIEALNAVIRLKNLKITSATVLDENGMSTRALTFQSERGFTKLRLPPNALYVVLAR